MPTLFIQLASVLVLATIFGIATRYFKQPLIIAYIATGIAISVLGIFREVDQPALDFVSNLGIAFLLFLIGVDLKIDDLKFVGKAAVLTSLGHLFFTVLVGFVLISALGYSSVPAIYIAFAMTFSSTVIVVKLLSEKHDLNSLYGKISVGFLIVQDFVAIIALMILSGFGAGQSPNFGSIALILVKGVMLVAFALIASRYLLRYLFKFTSASVELLFVSAIAWAFLLSALGAIAGFSVAIGAFLAGLSIASSPFRLEISARVKPLRDFFIVLFFIILGASMSVGAGNVLVSHVVILSLFILIGNPLIVLAIMFTLKFRNRTSFLTSVIVAQISEFSLILMAVGVSLGHLTSSHLALVSAVGIVTITTSSYLILYGNKIFKYVEKPLAKFFPERPRDPYISNQEELKEHIILVGAEQMGWDILEFLKKKYKRELIIVVDFNPEIIQTVQASGFRAVFADISDPEVLDDLKLGKAHLIIITDPDISDSSLLIKHAKNADYKGPIVATAYWMHDAVKLYENGADFVVVPELVGGKHVSKILSEHWDNLSAIKKNRSKNFEELMSRKIF